MTPRLAVEFSFPLLAGMPLDKALAVGVLPIPDGKIIAISFISRPHSND